MREEKKMLDAILGDFKLTDASAKEPETTLTIWISSEYKARYSRLQKLSKRRFARILREIVQAAIEKTEAKAS